MSKSIIPKDQKPENLLPKRRYLMKSINNYYEKTIDLYTVVTVYCFDYIDNHTRR